MTLSNIEIRFRIEGRRSIHEIYKNDKLQFALFHHVNKNGTERWKPVPHSSIKPIDQKDVAAIGHMIEQVNL